MSGIVPFFQMFAQTEAASIRFSWNHLSEHSVWVKNKNGWFEIGESYSFRSGSRGQGMGNEIFWSEIVKGLQGACTQPPPDIFLRVFRSNLREVSLDICQLPVPLKPSTGSFSSNDKSINLFSWFVWFFHCDFTPEKCFLQLSSYPLAFACRLTNKKTKDKFSWEPTWSELWK